MRSIIVAIVIIFTANIACSEIYKWRDENGTIHFSDKPSNDKPVELFVAPVDSIYENKYKNSPQQSLNYKQRNNNYPLTKGINSQNRSESTANTVIDKKALEEKKREQLKEMVEKEKNRPKSAEEIREEVIERRKQRRMHEEQLRRRGVYR